MMKNNIDRSPVNPSGTLILIVTFFLISASSLYAQSPDDSTIEPLRSDVGINGLTANFHWLNDFTHLDDDTLQNDGSSELEIVFRNVRMISPRLGVGFQVLGSFFVDSSGDETNFGIGSWGLGPMVRAYPFKTDRFQPYVQGKALFGNNMAVGPMANTEMGGDGFRVRMGLRGGVAYRISNSLGIFAEVGPDWESGRIFRADARTLQVNIGIDFYRFN